MKLKSGTTYWAKVNAPPPKYPRLRKNLRCDVAVIGGGITGALVAHRLVESGLDVVMLDKRPVGTGSTSASTALLLFDTDTSLAELARRHGRTEAVRAYRLGRQAIRELGRLVRATGIECGFAPKKSLYLASDAKGRKMLAREYRDRRRARLPAEWISRTRLRREFGLDFPAAIYSSGAAQVDAMRLAQGLIGAHAHARRLRVFHGRVNRIGRFDDRVELRAGRQKITANFAVIATGYEAAPFIEPELVDLHSSYVIASQPQPPGRLWKDECLIWETARPYFYLRTTADHRVLFGGEDEPFANPVRRDAKLAAKSKRLLARFRKIYPRISFEVEFAWTGTFGESRDGLPYIGARPDSARVLYALGYGGNGITFSQIAAQLIEQICHGRTPRDAQLFSFSRVQKHAQG